MILCDIAPGGHFVVTRVKVAGEIGRRLADMGFTEGAEGEMIRGALLRGPLQVRVRGCDLLIRRGEAACVDVEEPAVAAKQAEGGAARPGAGGPGGERTGDAHACHPEKPYGHGWLGFGHRLRWGVDQSDGCSGPRARGVGKGRAWGSKMQGRHGEKGSR